MNNIKDWIKHYKEVEYFPVGDGWKPLVNKLAEDITKIDDTIEVTQVKEKFGGLRFYTGGINTAYSKKVWTLIDKAEQESFKICEICGTRENVTTKGGWIITMCDKCRRKYENNY